MCVTPERLEPEALLYPEGDLIRAAAARRVASAIWAATSLAARSDSRDPVESVSGPVSFGTAGAAEVPVAKGSGLDRRPKAAIGPDDGGDATGKIPGGYG